MDFCMQVLKQIMLEEIKNPNSVLSMIAVGTTGDTLQLLLRVFRTNSIEEINQKSYEIMNVANNTDQGGPIITSINGVWVDKRYPLKASYAELLRRIFNWEANANFDFVNEREQVKKEINSWAEAASRGLIKEAIGSLDPLTFLVQANALYFKGTWKERFNPYFTETKQFFLLDGKTTQVPFLTLSWGSYDYGSFDGHQVLRVPYSKGRSDTSFSMYLFLPDEKKGLSNFLQTFNSCSEYMFMKPFLSEILFDTVRIPKFKFSYAVDDMEKVLKNMGINIPYNDNKLDYAETFEAPEDLPTPLWLKVIQKVYIGIDEYGTEACAVAAGLRGGGTPPPGPKFVADRPFMFVIKEDTSGLVFFNGIVLNPGTN